MRATRIQAEFRQKSVGGGGRGMTHRGKKTLIQNDFKRQKTLTQGRF